MSPTMAENDALKLLMRCDSFANDTSILAKLNRTNNVVSGKIILFYFFVITFVLSCGVLSKLKYTEIRNSSIVKALSAPRESSESLDITDDPSLDESWSSRQNSDKHEKHSGILDTPTRNLISKLNCLSSDWGRDDWTASQDSIESAPLSDWLVYTLV